MSFRWETLAAPYIIRVYKSLFPVVRVIGNHRLKVTGSSLPDDKVMSSETRGSERWDRTNKENVDEV